MGISAFDFNLKKSKMPPNNSEASSKPTHEAVCEYTYVAMENLFCKNSQICDADCNSYSEEEIVAVLQMYQKYPGCSDIEVCEFNPRGSIRSMRANAPNAQSADSATTTETTTQLYLPESTTATDSFSIFLKDASVDAATDAGMQTNCSLLLLVATLLAFLFSSR